MIKYFSVGCNKYKFLEKLNGCENDALLFSETVESISKCDSPECNVFESPTGSDFRKYFTSFLEQLSSNDRILFFFGGHGYSLEGEDRLATFDSKLDDIDSFISVSWIIDEFHKRNARATLFIDACRQRETPRGRGDSTTWNNFGQRSATKAQNTGVVLFFSCQPGESSWEVKLNSGQVQGVFTHLVCQSLHGLDVRTPITIDEHINSLAPAFYDEHPELAGSKKQDHFSSAQPISLANEDIFTGELGAGRTSNRGRLLIIAGPSNAGKTSLAQQLASKLKCRHFEMSSFAYERFNHFRSCEQNIDMSIQEFMEREVWNNRDYSVIANDFLDHYKDGEDCVLSGPRRPEEIEEIVGKISNFDMLFLFANARIRYDRHMQNMISRTRLDTSYKEFVKRDMKEFSWGMGKLESMERSSLMINENSIGAMLDRSFEKYRID